MNAYTNFHMNGSFLSTFVFTYGREYDLYWILSVHFGANPLSIIQCHKKTNQIKGHSGSELMTHESSFKRITVASKEKDIAFFFYEVCYNLH